VIHLFLLMVQKVDEAANFVFVQLIEQEPGICDKCHAGRTKQIWRGKKFLMRRRSLDPGFLSKQY
jgi:hypothetical protein